MRPSGQTGGKTLAAALETVKDAMSAPNRHIAMVCAYNGVGRMVEMLQAVCAMQDIAVKAKFSANHNCFREVHFPNGSRIDFLKISPEETGA